MESDELKELKESSLKEIKNIMIDKKNSYDNHIQEAAYWTSHDCKTLIINATTQDQIQIIMKIFNRYRYFI